MIMAEALGVVGGIIAVLQITNSVLSVCYDYSAAARGAPWEVPRIQKEMEDLRTILQNLEPIAKKAESFNPAQLQIFAGPLETCLKEVERLEKKLKSPDWTKNCGPKRTAIVQSLRWPLKEADTKKTLETISRIKVTLQLALEAHNTYAPPPADDENLGLRLIIDIDHWRKKYRSYLCLHTKQR